MITECLPKLRSKKVSIENYLQLIELIGAARENRTPDPIITNDVLYQLSYCGKSVRPSAAGTGFS